MKRQLKEKKKSWISVETNVNQIISIGIIFIVMFVFPIEFYTLYKNGELSSQYDKARVLGTSVIQDVQEGKFFDHFSLDKINSDVLIYGGAAIATVVFIITIYLILKPRNPHRDIDTQE